MGYGKCIKGSKGKTRLLIEPSQTIIIKGNKMNYSINIVWNIEDIKSLDDSLTDEECIEVLNLAKNDHDANIGINWDVLQFYIDHIKQR